VPVALVGLGLAGGLVLSTVLTDAGANHDAVRYSRFATEADAEQTPAWSPDGRTIAYSRVTDGLVQIFVRNLDSDNARQLTTDGGFRPFWWPNSDRIGYLGPGGIWTVSAVGGQPTLLKQGYFHDATLSPDGTLAAWRVVTGDGVTTATVVVASPADSEFVEYTPAPFKLTENMTTNAVAFSPDGSELLLAAFDPNAVRRLWRLPMPMGRGEPVEIATPLRRTFDVAWLPDNRRFVAVAAPEGSAESQLWLVDARTGKTTPLTSGLVTLSSPTVWGERVVVTAGQSDYDLVELPLDGTPVRDVFATGTNEVSGVWIPGTRRLIYATSRTGRGEIRMRDVSSGADQLVVAAPPGFTIGGAAPSPDGRNIAYHQVVPGSSVWITPIEGGTPQRISKDDGVEMGATWSPDSNRIAVYRAQAVRITNVGSGAVERDLPLSREPFGEPEWSPTGEWIAVPLTRGIALVDPTGATTRPDLVTDRRVSTVAWSADGRTLYAVDSLIGETRLLAITVDTGVVREVTRFVGVNVGTGSAPNLRLSFNVEGTALLTTSFRTNTDLWILDNLLPPPTGWRRWFGLR
jgi:Tol biopolymer transport system component